MKLAINGAEKTILKEKSELFHWPIVLQEDLDAVCDVIKQGTMSGTIITKKFEKEFSSWIGQEYGLAFCNGTASLAAAMWACGVGAGDEIIAPSMTYWASCAPALTLGASVNFCDIDRYTLCVDPLDIEKRINSRTKAIVVVHYAGHPCPMDEILAIAKKHNIKIIEDVSHAQGSLYKGKKCGSIGDVACMSMMAGKSFAIGEGGMLVTSNREIYERAIAYAHYERTGAASRFNAVDNQLTFDYLKKFGGIPQGAVKGRMNQTCAAMGRVQLKYYDDRIKEIQDATNYFWKGLEEYKGLRPHRPDYWEDSTCGGWYYCQGLFFEEEIGINAEKFTEAVKAEGVNNVFPGGNSPLHLHPYFNESDIFNLGKPTSIAFHDRDVRQGNGTLPISEKIHDISIAIPWFKHFDKAEIDKYVCAFKKVIENVDQIR